MTVAEWKAAVYQHRGLPASVKVLLLYLADHMADDLTVSVPHSDLAAGLGLLRQAVGRLIVRASDEGLLHLVEPARGRTPAVYRAGRRGNTGVASTGIGRGNTGVASSAVEATHVVRLREDAEPRRGNISARRGNTGVASTRDVSNTHQLPLEDSPSQHLQLLVLDDVETAPDSVTHGQVLHGSTSTAVSRRVGGPGGGIERPDVEALCRHLADRIEGNGNKRPAITKAWRDEARRMLDRDKRPLDQAHELIDWCQEDGFWSGNILGMPKFRKQYDQLRSKRLYEQQQQRRRRTRQSGPTDEYLKDAYARAAAYDEARGL